MRTPQSQLGQRTAPRLGSLERLPSFGIVTSPYIAELKEHSFWDGMGWNIALALAATADLEKPRIGLLVNTMPLP
jgi:hypothetical protein